MVEEHRKVIPLNNGNGIKGKISDNMTGDDLLAKLEALSNPHRLRILALLKNRRVHVSQLARDAQISRPLLYMHLRRLEEAGLVSSQAELAPDGKSMHFFAAAPFSIQLDPETIAAAVSTLTGKNTMIREEE